MLNADKSSVDFRRLQTCGIPRSTVLKFDAQDDDSTRQEGLERKSMYNSMSLHWSTWPRVKRARPKSATAAAQSVG